MDIINLTVEQILQYVGAISTLSFLIIAVSDLGIHCTDIIVQKFFAISKKHSAQSVVYFWSVMKDLYEEFRKFLDKLSAYSRPRNDQEIK